MANKKFSFDLDEYDDFDDIFNDKEKEKNLDLEENNLDEESKDVYEDFSQEDNYDYSDDEYEDYGDEEDDENLDMLDYPNQTIMKYLSLFSVWFLRIGIGIMVILIAYFITNGNILGLIKYILLLVVAFFFGYFFMYFLDKRKENN